MAAFNMIALVFQFLLPFWKVSDVHQEFPRIRMVSCTGLIFLAGWETVARSVSLQNWLDFHNLVALAAGDTTDSVSLACSGRHFPQGGEEAWSELQFCVANLCKSGLSLQDLKFPAGDRKGLHFLSAIVRVMASHWIYKAWGTRRSYATCGAWGIWLKTETWHLCRATTKACHGCTWVDVNESEMTWV